MKKPQPPVVTVSDLNMLYRIYDKARTRANDAEQMKNDASDEIKALLGETTEASTPEYIVTYRYDKDKEVVTFDEDAFMQKDPKAHTKYREMLHTIETVTKKYTKTTTVKGARKLLVQLVEHED